MADATKNIRFKTSIEGSDEVKGQFDEINQSIDKTSDVADNKLKPAMVDAQQYTMRVGKATQETTSKFAGLVGGLIGAAGVVGAMYLVGEALKQIKEEFKSTSEKVSELTEKLKENWSETFKTERAWDEFRATIAKWTVEEQVESLKNLEAELISLMPTFWEYVIATAMGKDAWNEFNKTFDTSIKQIELLRKSLEGDTGQGILTNLENELAALKLAQKNAMTKEEIADYNTLIAAKQNEINTLLGKQKTITGEILEDWIAIAKIIDKDIAGADMEPDILGDVGPMPEGFGMGMAYKQKGPRERRFEALDKIFGKEEEQKQRQEQFVNSWVNIMELNFSSFWEKTFGEANSILEQMLMTTFGAIFSNLMSSLLSFIPGGSIIGAIGGLFGGGGGGAGGATMPLVIQIGDVDVARVVLRGNQVIQQRRLS